MKVAILGTGGVGLAYAAFLHENGHDPVLWSPSGRGIAPFRDGAALTAEGVCTARFRPETAASPEIVSQCEAIIVALPAYAYGPVFDAVLPHVRSGSTFIISAHLSLACVHVARRLRERGVDATVVAWGTTLLFGRKTGPDAVEVGGIRQEVDIAALPREQGSAALATCAALFGPRFRLHHDVLAVQLGNLNPPVHLANALCNFTRIERGEAWSNYGGITPSVARLIEALDRERLALAAACGVEVRSIQRHYELTFGFAPGQDLAAMSAAVDRLRGGKPPGPRTLDTRFVTEDIPFGIVPVMRIAERMGVPVPLHAAGVAVFSALYGRDFAAENDLMAPGDLALVLPS
jgi:opine dehydrogenase